MTLKQFKKDNVGSLIRYGYKEHTIGIITNIESKKYRSMLEIIKRSSKRNTCDCYGKVLYCIEIYDLHNKTKDCVFIEKLYNSALSHKCLGTVTTYYEILS